MTDDDALPVPAPSDDGEVLLYDYFKHLTTLALLALGGVLTLSQMADREDVRAEMLIVVLVIIGLAGVASFIGAGEIVRTRYKGEPRQKSIELCRRASPALLALGVGMFMAMFVDTLN